MNTVVSDTAGYLADLLERMGRRATVASAGEFREKQKGDDVIS